MIDGAAAECLSRLPDNSRMVAGPWPCGTRYGNKRGLHHALRLMGAHFVADMKVRVDIAGTTSFYCPYLLLRRTGRRITARPSA